MSIDPGFLAAHPGYSLVFGATSPSSVPEPSTWVMLGLGFAGLGYTGLRRGGVAGRAPPRLSGWPPNSTYTKGSAR